MSTGIRPDILRAAARLFGELGYERTTLEDVAQAIGIKKGSLYYHISSKEDLLFALHERLVDELLANAQTALQAGSTPEAKLRGVIHAAMQLIAEHREEVTVFLHERHAFSSERWGEIVVKRDAFQLIVEDVIREGVSSGAFRKVPADVATLGLLGMVNWGYQWFDPAGRMSAEEIADLFADIAIRGLKADKPEEGGGSTGKE